MRSLKDFDALTIHQPYAWAIAAGLKLVENRSWKPTVHGLHPGGLVAIHAGAKQPDFEAVAFARELAVRAGRGAEVPQQFVCGAIVAMATLDRVVTSREELEPSQRGWWVGPFGWVLRDVRPLPQPIGCRGQQGLWSPTGELVFQVWDQLEPRREGQGAA